MTNNNPTTLRSALINACLEVDQFIEPATAVFSRPLTLASDTAEIESAIASLDDSIPTSAWLIS